jgi:hypothetical protein
MKTIGCHWLLLLMILLLLLLLLLLLPYMHTCFCDGMMKLSMGRWLVRMLVLLL